MTADAHKARVFISCGQNEARGEVLLARQVASVLAELGFAPYIAVEEQTLLGIKERIFKVLEESEYFLFIDFEREQLDHDSGERRGSLFTNQELAVAAFLDKDVIALRERGVRKLDGLTGFLMANAVEFAERSKVPALVAQLVRERGWTNSAFNGLRLEVNAPPFRDAQFDSAGTMGRFFHVRVINGHPSRAAENCYAYLDKVEHADDGMSPYYETAELKWAGYVLPGTRIAPGGYRLVDAFWVIHQSPETPQFNVFTDSTQFIPMFGGPGSWIITLSVVSSTVRGATAKFAVTLSSDLARTNLVALAK